MNDMTRRTFFRTGVCGAGVGLAAMAALLIPTGAWHDPLLVLMAVKFVSGRPRRWLFTTELTQCVAELPGTKRESKVLLNKQPTYAGSPVVKSLSTSTAAPAGERAGTHVVNAGLDVRLARLVLAKIARPRGGPGVRRELLIRQADELARLGEKLSARLTYLLEPISPIEIDREGCVLQMRSNPPQRNDDQTTYYELTLRRGGAFSLSRYSKAFGDARQAIPATVTREVFLRLVADFSAVAPA